MSVHRIQDAPGFTGHHLGTPPAAHTDPETWPTIEQIEEAEREADPLPVSYYVVVAIVALSILCALSLALDVHWLFAAGPTL